MPTPPPTPPGDEPKLIIDSDWKAQAQAEKDRLASANKPKAAASPVTGDAGSEAGVEEKLGFQDLVSMFATQALTYMGAFPDPRTGKAVLAPEYARLYIDMLGILRDKTKGNLTPDEQKLVDQTLSELRAEFVELVKAVDKAVAEGKIKPQQFGGMGAAGTGVVVPPAGGIGGGMGGVGGGQIFGG